ncbi:hypothetical protein [Mycolicibacterium sarraceniae]|uniref:hypothetical protein n=1 Tax=Mycolicibacterium sarraceniae TaxID=1534348 RepID=UPI003898ED9B
MTAIDDRDRAWTTLYDEVKSRLDDVTLDGRWETRIRSAFNMLRIPLIWCGLALSVLHK